MHGIIEFMCIVWLCVVNLQFTKLFAYRLVVTNFQEIRERIRRIDTEDVDIVVLLLVYFVLCWDVGWLYPFCFSWEKPMLNEY